MLLLDFLVVVKLPFSEQSNSAVVDVCKKQEPSLTADLLPIEVI